MNRLTDDHTRYAQLALIISIGVLLTLLHYVDVLGLPQPLADAARVLLPDRHAFDRILFLVPIIWAGALFGVRGAVIASAVALAIMLPRVLFVSGYSKDAASETVAVLLVGNIVIHVQSVLRREREQRLHLEALDAALRAQVRATEENQRRLGALYDIGVALSALLDLDKVLKIAVEKVAAVMQVDGAWVFLMAREGGELSFVAHTGFSNRFASDVGRMDVGEGFNGRVAQTGEPLFVADAPSHPALTRHAVTEEGLRSLLIAPLRAQGGVVGTIGVATRTPREFDENETRLLCSIGSQIGVAVENARLYGQLRDSERQYRALFETAHDAVWLHDLDGTVLMANQACEALTGYSREELVGMSTRQFVSADSLPLARQQEEEMLAGATEGSILEVAFLRKDGAPAIVQLATAIVRDGDWPLYFQHVARDVTEKRRMEESLQRYVQQITRAQEDERLRIARELHDVTIQDLVVLARQLDEVVGAKDMEEPRVRMMLEACWQDTNRIMADLRRLSRDLKPATLDRLGLVAALESLAADVERGSDVRVKVILGGAIRRLSNEVELALFRIAQEAIRNAERHASASEVDVHIDFSDGTVLMRVRDNGLGFDAPKWPDELVRLGKLGLAGMHERARLVGGSLTIESVPGEGTTVTVRVP